MRKKLLLTATAMVTSVSVVAAPVLTVFAEDTDKQVVVENGDTKEIKGNVTVDGGLTAIIISDEKSAVTVEGNVTTTGEQTSTIQDYSESHGGTGISASSGTTVTVTGNVTTSSAGTGISANGAEVTVGGNVTSNGQYTVKSKDSEYKGNGTAISASNESEINISGDVASTGGGKAIDVDSGSTVDVEGNVTASGQTTSTSSSGTSKYGYGAIGASNDKTEVRVKGDVNSSNGGAAVIASDKAAVNISGNVNRSGNYSSTYKDDEGKTSTSTGANYAVRSNSGASVNIEKNVTSENGGSGVYAQGENTTLNVKGDVTSSGSTVSSSDGEYHYSGTTGAYSSDGATISIGGNLTGTTIGISAGYNGTVNVDGNVNATGGNDTVYRYDSEKDKSEYDTQYYGRGIYTDGEADIKVGKDVNAATVGIKVAPDNGDAANTIIVEGTIKAGNGEGIMLGSDNPAKGIKYENIEDFLDDIPTLVIGGIDAATPIAVSTNIAGDTSEETQNKVKEAVIKAINYIVGVDEASKEKCEMEVSGDAIKKVANYDTLHVNDSFNLAAKIPDGYDLVISDNVEVKDNKDGTYTITLLNEKGGINIRAVLRKVDNDYVVEVQETNTPPAGSEVVPTGAIVVSSAPAPALGTAPSAISGEKAAKTVTLDLGKVTTAQYKEAVIENVATAPAGGAFNIETDRVSVFDRKMIEAFAARPDIDINVVFTYLGRKIKVTIPAGYNVLSLLDANGYCGFLRLLQLLGGTDL